MASRFINILSALLGGNVQPGTIDALRSVDKVRDPFKKRNRAGSTKHPSTFRKRVQKRRRRKEIAKVSRRANR